MRSIGDVFAKIMTGQDSSKLEISIDDVSNVEVPITCVSLADTYTHGCTIGPGTAREVKQSDPESAWTLNIRSF